MNPELEAILENKGLELSRLNEDCYPWGFQTGRNDGLGEWLENLALGFQEDGMCTVWLLHEKNQISNIFGFFSLSPHQIHRKSMMKKDQFTSDIHSTRTALGKRTTVPAYLLGKFAVAKEHQGGAIGLLLMTLVHEKFVQCQGSAAGKALVLDVTNDKLLRYYQDRYGFKVLDGGAGEKTSMYKSHVSVRLDLEKMINGIKNVNSD